jgi:hypothetical protein
MRIYKLMHTLTAKNTRPTGLLRQYEYVLVLALAIGLLLLINSVTNANPIGEFEELYSTIAVNGFASGNPNLQAPTAYRFLTPVLSGAVARLFSLRISTGFQIVTCISIVLQLLLTYVMAKSFGASISGALTMMLIVALSVGHVKNSLFFNLGLENVAQTLMLVFTLAFFRRKLVLCLLIVIIGLWAREFFLIPAALLCYWAGSNFVRERTLSSLLWAALTITLVAAAFILPRLLIPVTATIQLVDPMNDPGSLRKLLTVPGDLARDKNIVAAMLSYILPTLLLVTPQRLRHLIPRLAPYRTFLIIYCGTMFVLTMYGGTDLYRYMTYLYIPQIIVLSIVFSSSAPSINAWEIPCVLVVVLVHNRILLPIPDMRQDLNAYLDFWPGFENRFNAAAIRRLFEIVIAVAGMTLSRYLLAGRREPKRVEFS